MEEDEGAQSTIDKYISCNYLKKFDTLKEAKDFVKHDPVLNKLGLVVRERKNP